MTNLEHGILCKPQIVSGVPALKETLGRHGIIIEPVAKTMIANFESHGGEIYIFNPDDFADALFNVYKFYTESDKLKILLEENYNWEKILSIL